MKKLLTVLFLFVSVLAFSQNNGINFQGVGRNSSGAVLASTKISLRFSVIQNSETGTVEYVESKEVTTNAQGIFSVVIGDGTQISKTGNFSDINWKINPKFLKVEMDPAGGSSFVAMGTTRLQAVPFAYYANGVNADNVDGVLSASKGGTGVASIAALKTALAIDQINNTSDLAKPISTATQAALDTKVSTATFSTTVAAKANVSDLDLKAPIDSPTFTGTVAGITKAMVGLGSVDNTSDIAKPISTLTKEALDTKVSTSVFSTTVATKANTSDLALKAPIDSPTFTGTVAGITKAMVGLGSVNNTSDLAKPISNATQEALDTKVSSATFSTNIASKENSTNKSTAIDLGGSSSSDILFPTQKAVKTYIDGQISSGGVQDGGITTIKLADGAVTDAKVASGIAKSKVGLGNVENTALSTWTGSTNISQVGTITSGVWSGTSINYSKLNLSSSIVNSDISNSAAIPFSKLNIVKSDIVGLGIPGSDQNTTYSAGNGLTLSGTTFSIGSGAINSTAIADGTISNLDINSSAAINYSKLNLGGSIVGSDISTSAAIPFSKLNITQSDITNLGIASTSDIQTYTAGSGLTLSGSTFSVASNVVTSTYNGAVTLNGSNFTVDNNSIYVDGTNHKVGIGTYSPTSKFEVNGSATNSNAYNANSNSTIDFSLSNLAYTTASAGNFTLSNIKDGGTYTLAVQGNTSGTSTFSSSGFTFYSTNNGATTSNKQTLYTFIVMGSRVYFYMATGF